jgi:riboflavin kinase/FMN adenylyltransferase
MSENIYNKKLKITMLEHIRDERKFNSLSDLQAQLEKDKLFSLNYIQNLK